MRPVGPGLGQGRTPSRDSRAAGSYLLAGGRRGDPSHPGRVSVPGGIVPTVPVARHSPRASLAACGPESAAGGVRRKGGLPGSRDPALQARRRSRLIRTRRRAAPRPARARAPSPEAARRERETASGQGRPCGPHGGPGPDSARLQGLEEARHRRERRLQSQAFNPFNLNRRGRPGGGRRMGPALGGPAGRRQHPRGRRLACSGLLATTSTAQFHGTSIWRQSGRTAGRTQ